VLGRNRGPTFCGVELTEGGIKEIEGLIRQLADPLERITGRKGLLDRNVGEQGALVD